MGLLSGLYEESVTHYLTDVEHEQSSNDYLWTGSALEGAYAASNAISLGNDIIKQNSLSFVIAKSSLNVHTIVEVIVNIGNNQVLYSRLMKWSVNAMNVWIITYDHLLLQDLMCWNLILSLFKFFLYLRFVQWSSLNFFSLTLNQYEQISEFLPSSKSVLNK